MLEKLTAMGELENTWIFYTSDHGIAIGRHVFKENKILQYTEEFLIVKGPGVRAGRSDAGIRTWRYAGNVV